MIRYSGLKENQRISKMVEQRCLTFQKDMAKLNMRSITVVKLLFINVNITKIVDTISNQSKHYWHLLVSGLVTIPKFVVNKPNF